MRFLFIIVAFAITSSYAQTRKPKTYLFVHGAWAGGWDYARVDSILRVRGDIVYRPTLTGVGERRHLSNAGVNLTTYITDIVNVIKFEDLHHVILVGHSYAGMVISGVADQIPERISQLVYLDAMVPNDGESARDVCGQLWDKLMAPNVRDSVLLYPFGATKGSPPMDVPQPLQSFTEPLRITNSAAKKIPTAYIQMTHGGKTDPAFDKMGVVRARLRGWPVYTFEGGHYSMREQPANLVRKLELILSKVP